MSRLDYEDKKRLLSQQLQANASGVRLKKNTSNLFRSREKSKRPGLDVRHLDQVLDVDGINQLVEVEGMTTYAGLTEVCLKQNCMPLVVPQLKSITIGGAVAGIGIESTSFRHGLPHESVTALDVLLADGDIVTSTADNAYADLFFGIPNSYGTLGYVLKVTAKTMPVKPYVELQHRRFTAIDEYFTALDEACSSDVDFVDGTVFSGDEMYLSLGHFRDEAPFTSDYTWLKMYFRSIRERQQDFLSIDDYLWRWDTDWFWCSKNLYVQNLPLRLLLGRRWLNSISYQKVMRLNNRLGLTAAVNRIFGRQPESVIQDVDIPLAGAAEFLRFFLEDIDIRPLWICPIGGHDPLRHFPLYPLSGDGLFINFGFWDIVANPKGYPSGHFNRKIENKVNALGGIKSLYSDAFYDEAEFWRQYDGAGYFDLKRKYDPNDRLPNLYQKCVLNQ